MTPTITPEAARLAEEAKHLVLNALDPFYIDTDRHEEINSAIDALAALAKQDAAPTSEPEGETMDMALCEIHSVVIRPGQRYTFSRVGDCEKCAEMEREAGEAYGEPKNRPVGRHQLAASAVVAHESLNVGCNAACLSQVSHNAPTSASTVPAGFWLAPMEPDAEMFDAAKYDESFIEAWDDMRNAYLARNPGACSVTDGEAKK